MVLGSADADHGRGQRISLLFDSGAAEDADMLRESNAALPGSREWVRRIEDE
jgi:hypothetical protein